MKIYFDEIIGAWTVEFLYYGRTVHAYFRREKQAQKYFDLLTSKLKKS